MKEEGKTSKAPLTESFGQWKNLKIVILALVGLTAGQAVVWYTGQFYALFFLTGAEGRRRDREHPDRVLAAHRHAVLHRLRLAVRQDRPQADHHGRLPDRGADLFPAVQGADRLRQPRLAQAQAANRSWWSPTRSAARSSSTRPARRSSQLLRHRQARLASRSVSYENEAAPAGTVADQDRRQGHHRASSARLRAPKFKKQRQGRRVQEGRMATR